MTAPSTALAHPAFRSRADMDLVLQEKREIAEMARAFRATQWGKDLDDAVARAMAAWCKRHDIDATEVSVLGGSPYIEASYYLRKLSEMDADLLEYARADHVERDPRLEEMAKIEIPTTADEAQKAFLLGQRAWAMGEGFRRQQERITHGLTDLAPAAVVFRVKRRGVEGEFTGADECGLRKTKRVWNKFKNEWQEKTADPVGDENPRKTAESRAARRCLRQVISTFPGLDTKLKLMEREAKEQVAVEISQGMAASDPPRIGTHSVASAGQGVTEALEETAGSQEIVVEAEDQQLSEEESRNQGPRVKAQIHNLEKLLYGPLFTDEEREGAADFASNATYGEMADRIQDVKLERLQRERAAARREASGAGAPAA